MLYVCLVGFIRKSHFQLFFGRLQCGCTEFFDLDIVSMGVYLKSQFDVVERGSD